MVPYEWAHIALLKNTVKSIQHQGFVLWMLYLLSIVGCSPKIIPHAANGNFEGKIQRIEFPSRYIGTRTVDVWLPASYPAQAPYKVIYMQDGQMLFDAGQTWNKQEWKVDETLSRLMGADSIQAVIVVGIWNAGHDRHAEYMPQKVYEACPSFFKDSIAHKTGDHALFSKPVYSDTYLKFLVNELKPFIDKKYAVESNAASTTVAGSSMGALISLYALCEYPAVFGSAICMSTHWIGSFGLEKNPIPGQMLTYLRKALPAKGGHKLYFDRGTIGLESLYEHAQLEADALFLARYADTKKFTSKVYQGSDHSEAAWAERLNIPLIFVYPKTK